VKRFYADLGLLLVALIWGSTFPVIKIALDSMSPFAFNAVRFLISCLFFIPFLKKESFVIGFKIGIASFLGYAFQTVGLEYTTATNAGFITSTYVVLTPIIAYLIYKVRFDTRDVASIILAFLGIYFLSGYSGFNIGDILMLLCALAFGAEIAMISHHSRLNNPTMLAFWQTFAIFILSTPFAAFTTAKFEINESVIAALLITAFFATFIAKMLQNWLQSYTKPSDAAVILSMEGVFSHLFSAFLLAEMLNMLEYFGAFLILVAVITVSLRSE
jgi:drug/metabolite transporter (DMT)-like permease